MTRKEVKRSTKNGTKKLIYYGIVDLTNSEDEAKIDKIESSIPTEIVSSEETVLLVGDVIWSKVTGHSSWWPSMISYEPNAGIYFQASLKNPKVPLKYHVQFFGKKPMRGWVAKSNILKFQGRESFVKLIPLCSTLASGQRENWEQAVLEAERASQLERKERKLAYVFNYSGNSKATEKKREVKKRTPKAKKVQEPDSIRQSLRLATLNSKKNLTKACVKKSKKIEPLKLPIKTDQCCELPIESVSNVTTEKQSVERKSCEAHETSLVRSELKESESVLKDISWSENQLLNRIPYRDGENSSDSGIEDVEVETEFSIAHMELVGEKRKRKQKVFDGFHTGDEIEDAFKRKSKPKLDATDKGDEQTASNHNNEKENMLLVDGACTSKDGNAKCNSNKKSASSCDIKNEEAGRINDPTAVASNNVTNISSNDTSISPKKQSKRKHSEKSCDSREQNVQEEVVPAKKGKKDKIKSCNLSKNDSVKVNDNNAKETCAISSTDESNWAIPVEVGRCKPGDKNAKGNHRVEAVCDSQNGLSSKLRREQKDHFCALCEELNDGDLVCCSGTCLNQFHPNCLGLNFKPNTDFVCDECASGFHTCFACRKAGELKKCSHSNCGKYYHIQCVESQQGTKFESKLKDKFTCPLHVCKFCSKSQSAGGKKFKCIRCPTAYHYSCLTAGCFIMTSSHMICDEHYEPDKKNNKFIHTNANWCFICSVGGSLVCCDTCPASFHPECSDDLTGVPEGAWQCQDCRNGIKLRYGDIVWVKFSVYRWWPGKICYPEDVPERIQNLSHSVGEFPVLFFGSRDYIWLNSRRVFKYADGDKGTKEPGRRYLAKYFLKALEEAKEAFAELEKVRMEKNQACKKKDSKKPPSYRHIKCNRPVTCIQTVLDESEWPICECKVDDPCGSDCLNKMLFYECNPLKCPNREKCRNQRMQKCEYAKCQPFKSETKGWGLQACQEIKTGDFVIEYVGELIDEHTCRQRIKQYYEKDIYDYYFLTIDKDNIIDAYPKGNLSRFMNHSCDPNCETQKWTVDGQVRVGLFATRDIAFGDELCFNYNLDCLGNEKKQCRCGSTNCSGLLGVQPKTQHSIANAEKAKKVEEKRKLHKKKKVQKIVHDDECYTCGDGGELILCDRAKCTKAYHQECLIMEERPWSKWECPWHFCDECGKPAKSMCSLCPNSFCHEHIDGQMTELEADVITCPFHNKVEVAKLRSRLEGARKKGSIDSCVKKGDNGSSVKIKRRISHSTGGNVPIGNISAGGNVSKQVKKSSIGSRNQSAKSANKSLKKVVEPRVLSSGVSRILKRDDKPISSIKGMVKKVSGDSKGASTVRKGEIAKKKTLRKAIEKVLVKNGKSKALDKNGSTKGIQMDSKRKKVGKVAVKRNVTK